ncbi:MAG: PAS domain S-box protein, partial [Desulfobacterales bacterium]
SVYPDAELRAHAQARMAAMREGVNLEAEEWEITRADGGKRTLRISTSVLDQEDRSPRVMAIMHDVTAQRQAEERLRKTHQDLERQLARQSTSLVDASQALKDSDARYRSLFEHASDALFIENDDDQILDANPKACELLGYSREELRTMTVPDIQAPECRGEKGAVLRDELNEHRGKPFEVVDLHKDGTRIPVEVTNTRFGNEGLILSIVRDIRERKLVEQERRNAYQILENSPVTAFLWRNETDWPVTYVTRNVVRIFGYSAEDFQSGRIAYSRVVHPEDLERVTREVFTYSQETDREAFSHEPYRIVAKDGTVRWVDDKTFIRRDQNGRITHYQGLVEDRTEQVTASDALRRAKRQQSAILENIPDIAWLKDRESRFIAVNGPFAKACGQTPAEVVGQTDLDIWPRSLAERYRADDAEVILTRRQKTVEEPLLVSSGQRKLIETIKTPIFDDEGHLIGTTGIARDITRRKQLEEDLLAEKERLAVTLRSIGDAVITTDRQGRITLMNPIAERLTGWPEADALGRPLMEVFKIVNEQTREPCANPVEKVLATAQVIGLANQTLLVAKNGQEFIIADSGAPILNSQGEITGVVLVFRDITDQQRTEKELLKMEKLSSLGVLAGGLAHDFNNFLTGIIGNLSLAKLDIQPGNSILRTLNEMEKAALRAKDLTQQLLTFSKGGEPVKHTLCIVDLVRESAQFALHGSNVRCTFDFDEALQPTDVDEGQIAQVMHNLVINADQAMPNGGTVSIEGVNVTLPPDNPFALNPGRYIQLSIRDEGMGIHRDHLKKVFDPYFSTKQKGSGLGLAVAYSIIAKHDGQLTVDSKLGEGTTFTLLLPASESAEGMATEAGTGFMMGSGRVLVMDDEDFIRELAKAMLGKMGYEVELAQDGQAAVKMYANALAAGVPFDAVILDLTIPGGMGGKEALGHLLTLDPNVRAIVSSGYSNDPVMANHTNYGFCGAVHKPYLVQEMSQVLKAVIAT